MNSPPPLIEPRVLKGFRDYLPAVMMPRERLMETARRVYRLYGFAPIDTPALEYVEILTGKGGARGEGSGEAEGGTAAGEETAKQMYRFTDHGGREVALRFDLTVPLARFAAQHIGRLGTPFKRYHIAPVWRGENTQRGRYREFVQCDFDTIGTLSLAADIETALVIHDLLLALGMERFTIRVNNRKVLNGLLERLGLGEKSASVLRSLDKLGKLGRDQVAAEMVQFAGATAAQAETILQLAELEGETEAVLAALEPLTAGSATGEQGVRELREVLAGTAAAGVPAERLRLDVSIARGLDYYTGTIYETFLEELPGIGSVCSGGRYDNLAGLFTKQQLPGIGASLGLDRLLAALEELGRLENVQTAAPVFLPYFEADRLAEYLRIAALLRGAGIGVELYPEPKKIGQQLKYGDKRGFRLAVIAGANELAAGKVQLKDFRSEAQFEVALGDDGAELVAAVRKLLDTPPA